MVRLIILSFLVIYPFGAYFYSNLYYKNSNEGLFITLVILSIIFFLIGFNKKIRHRVDFNFKPNLYVLLLIFSTIWLYDIYSSVDYSFAADQRLTNESHSGFINVIKEWFYIFTLATILSRIKTKSAFLIFCILLLFLYPVLLTGQRKLLSEVVFVLFMMKTELIQLTFKKTVFFVLIGFVGISGIQLITHIRGAEEPLNNILSAFNYSDNIFQFLLFSGGEFVIPYSTLIIFLQNQSSYEMLDGWLIPIMSYIPNFIFSMEYRGLAELFMYNEFPSLAREGRGYGLSAVNSAYWRLGLLGVVIEFYLLGRIIKLLLHSAIYSASSTSKFMLYAGIFTIGIETIRGDLLMIPKIFLMTFLFLIFKLRVFVRN